MEGMPAHNNRNEQYQESDAVSSFSREAVEVETMEHLQELLAPIEQLEVFERIAFIEELLQEKATTEPGTMRPLNNDNRFIVEALAARLTAELKDLSPREKAQYEYARLVQALNLDVVN